MLDQAVADERFEWRNRERVSIDENQNVIVARGSAARLSARRLSFVAWALTGSREA